MIGAIKKGTQDFIYVQTLSLNLLRKRWKSIGLILVIPFVIYFVISAFTSEWISFVYSNFQRPDTIDNETFLFDLMLTTVTKSFLAMLPGILAWVLVVINIHRAVILKKGLRIESGWFKVLLRFLWVSLIIAFIYTAFTVPVYIYAGLLGLSDEPTSVLNLSLSIVWCCIGIPILARSSLMLPAAAVGYPSGLLHSWRVSSGNTALMIIITVLIPLFISLFFVILYLIPLPNMVIQPVNYLLGGVLLVVEVTLLSVTYILLAKRISNSTAQGQVELGY